MKRRTFLAFVAGLLPAWLVGKAARGSDKGPGGVGQMAGCFGPCHCSITITDGNGEEVFASHEYAAFWMETRLADGARVLTRRVTRMSNAVSC